MNILPKKKWHVRTKDNIARVRRDEQQAADEEKEKQRKKALAEQEARTDVLRRQARERVESLGGEELAGLFGTSSDVPVNEEPKPAQHVNIFEDAEQGAPPSTWNMNRKRRRNRRNEKGIGYLTYLGQSAQEAQHAKPWYTLDHDKRAETKTSSGMILNNPVKNSDEKLKTYYDPLQAMKGYLSRGAKSESSSKPLAITASASQFSSAKRDSSPNSELSKKRLKKDEQTPEVPESKGKTIEELRHERLRREERERQRTKQFLAEKSGTVSALSRSQPPPPREGKQKYNSQFNPGLARQNIYDSDRHGHY
ncbi:putative Leukocyte receptor cluster member 1-like protein [Hypsibius exemplaris]|uniref:Leukocyte receptor cluster member 1-like protein n=1 Tax=Hypsibius exemplaris TaxID=2072580 RepID=A0A1W0X3E9_HYPEX|nr:putative Leukocyte receptor cluster member 1-like protein [Hypsibius exemplaris]